MAGKAELWRCGVVSRCLGIRKTPRNSAVHQTAQNRVAALDRSAQGVASPFRKNPVMGAVDAGPATCLPRTLKEGSFFHAGILTLWRARQSWGDPVQSSVRENPMPRQLYGHNFPATGARSVAGAPGASVPSASTLQPCRGVSIRSALAPATSSGRGPRALASAGKIAMQHRVIDQVQLAAQHG